jgi:benzoate/toluate 1,2-dioxygenase beta subunit
VTGLRPRWLVASEVNTNQGETQMSGIEMELKQEVNDFIQLEAQLLDTQNWDAWLNLYDPNVEYWVPMWDDDGKLTTDPQREMSMIYYKNRDGLEDRIFRIRTNKSSASTPVYRTSHIRSFALVSRDGDLIKAAFNWATHGFRRKHSVAYFGRKEIWLKARAEGGFGIVRSHTILQNDLIDQVLDVYHL